MVIVITTIFMIMPVQRWWNPHWGRHSIFGQGWVGGHSCHHRGYHCNQCYHQHHLDYRHQHIFYTFQIIIILFLLITIISFLTWASFYIWPRVGGCALLSSSLISSSSLLLSALFGLSLLLILCISPHCYPFPLPPHDLDYHHHDIFSDGGVILYLAKGGWRPLSSLVFIVSP